MRSCFLRNLMLAQSDILILDMNMYTFSRPPQNHNQYIIRDFRQNVT